LKGRWACFPFIDEAIRMFVCVRLCSHILFTFRRAQAQYRKAGHEYCADNKIENLFCHSGTAFKNQGQLSLPLLIQVSFCSVENFMAVILSAAKNLTRS
jgi:hypothetical protein